MDRLLEDLHEVIDVLINEGRGEGYDEPGLAFLSILADWLLLSHHLLILLVFTRVDA